jgi:hypothetical protein
VDKYVIAILAIVLMITAGCDISKKEFCKPPYIEFQQGECCLDNDETGICDQDESGETQEEESVRISSGPQIMELDTLEYELKSQMHNIYEWEDEADPSVPGYFIHKTHDERIIIYELPEGHISDYYDFDRHFRAIFDKRMELKKAEKDEATKYSNLNLKEDDFQNRAVYLNYLKDNLFYKLTYSLSDHKIDGYRFVKEFYHMDADINSMKLIQRW